MDQTILFDDREGVALGATIENESLWIEEADLERATGWHLESRGVCRGAQCIPAPRGADWNRDGRFNLSAFATHRGQGVARDDAAAIWSFGPPAGVRFADGMAPDFELPNFQGRMHALSQYRGTKVLLITWASW